MKTKIPELTEEQLLFAKELFGEKNRIKTRKQLIRRICAQNDELWSYIVKIRDNYVCQACVFEHKIIRKEENVQILPHKSNQAMHFQSRVNWYTRHDTRNGACGCYHHHQNCVDGGQWDPDKTKKFWIWTLGSEELYDELKRDAKKPFKKNFENVKCVNDGLKTELWEMTNMTFKEIEEGKYKGGMIRLTI